MYVDECNVCFNLEDRDECDAKGLEDASKASVLNDDELVDDPRFLFLECVSGRCLIDEGRADNEDVQNSGLAKDDISCERRHFDENH
jgi:dynactin complex subunit